MKKKQPSRKEKRIMEDSSKQKVPCHQCWGDGYIFKGRHWYSQGWKVKCTYCDGTGEIWE